MFRRALIAFVVAAAIALAPTGASARGGFGGGGFHGSGFHGGFARQHDGYRLIVHREGKRVRLLTRRGYDCSGRYPLIAEPALRVRKMYFVIDGEAVVLGPDGISDFEGLHSGRCNEDVRLYAFDLPADDGVGYARRDAANPQAVARKLLKRSGDGTIYNDHDAGAIGSRLFEQVTC